jgi:hypothetical protein
VVPLRPDNYILPNSCHLAAELDILVQVFVNFPELNLFRLQKNGSGRRNIEDRESSNILETLGDHIAQIATPICQRWDGNLSNVDLAPIRHERIGDVLDQVLATNMKLG